MNVKFRELADQADIVFGFDKAGNEEVICAPTDIEKFAELIVKECMNVLDPGGHQLIARFHTRQWLSEHFGVK
jgi:hypothetical protein